MKKNKLEIDIDDSKIPEEMRYFIPAMILAFKKIDYSKYPQRIFFNEDFQEILFALLIGTSETGYEDLSVKEIREILKQKFNLDYKTETIEQILNVFIGSCVDKTYRITEAVYSITDMGIQALSLKFDGNKKTVEKIVLIPNEIFSKSHSYYKKIVNQINGCYSHGFFDGCAVLIRRLIETLIVNIYEERKKLGHIQNKKTGNFFQLEKLINLINQDSDINLTRDTRDLLKEAKFFGDTGAHHRKAHVLKQNLDNIKNVLGTSVQEFVSLVENP